MIIPAYNVQRYLPQCLDSVLAAPVNDVELLIVDDGSTDDTLAVAQAYAKQYPFIRVFTQENAGPSRARNLGLSQACGRYVTFCDGDDTVNPERFAQAVRQLDCADAELWVSDFHRVSDSGAVLDRVYQIRETDSPIVDSRYLGEFISAKDCIWNVWRYIYKRDFLERADLRFVEGYHCAEDLEFIVRVILHAERIAFFHNPYYNYRVNYGNTLTRRYTAARTEQLMAMLERAYGRLSSSENAIAPVLMGKISREYILSLSLYAQCPPAERPTVLHSLTARRALLDGACGPAYRLAARFIRVAGIPAAAHILNLLKQAKHLARKYKEGRADHGR